MKKLAIGLLTLALLNPISAEAAKTVPYKNQKAGQFCKTIDIKKTVKLPNGTKLKCVKEGSRARWKAK
jgi:hypothetical protein